MKKFKVFWTQHHVAEVRTESKEDAKTISMGMCDMDTMVDIRYVVVDLGEVKG